MAEGENFTLKNKRLGKSGVKYILGIPLSLILQAAILFVSAGRIDMPWAWIYLCATFVYYLTHTILLYELNPELLIQRAERKKDAKTWDKVLLLAFIILQFIVQLIVIGLDVGRFQWSGLGIHFSILGLALYVTSAVIVTWAMAVNPHFEATVRIQKDRDHRVITTGPYRIVRHPGYVGMFLWSIAPPLIMGSVYGLIPGGICVLLLIIRTWLEDKTLINELNGYAEYAKRVKYRLFPGVW
jgi:protein-S-isoprenylcysteine O-methyltransferase Ste14